MKKTLVILLALLAAASISLASCSDNGRVNVDDNDDDDVDYIEDQDTDDTTDDVTNDGTNDETNNGGNTTDEYGFEEKNDTVYAGTKLNVRVSPSTSAEAATQVEAGTALTRIATNGTWDKVKLAGDENVYYVASKWVNIVNNFNFTAVDPATELKLSDSADAKNVCFFQTPHVAWNGNDYDYTNIACASGLKLANLTGNDGTRTYTLQKIGENANWIKVKFTGTIEISTNNTLECTDAIFYIRVTSIGANGVIDNSTTSGGNGGAAG